MADESSFKSLEFRKVAFAIAFSPRLDAILSEAERMQKMLNCYLVLIHIGSKNSGKEQELEAKLAERELPAEKREVIWESGNPANEILEICHKEQVDLLVMGALQRESLLSYYIGSVARKICRKGDFSIMLLTEPANNPVPVKKMVVSAPEHPKTGCTLSTALTLAELYNTEEVFLVRESSMYGFAKMIRESSSEESNKFEQEFIDQENENLNKVLNSVKESKIKISTRVVGGKPGYEIAKFARRKGANLLVVNSPDSKLGVIDRFFPHDLEHVLADLPCSLLIVHPSE